MNALNRIREALASFVHDWWRWANDLPRWFLIAPAAAVAVLWLLLWWLA